jgi:Zn-dependent M28 family amino/carboxypeptidase
VAQLQAQAARRAEAAVDRVTERLLALAAKAEAKDDVRALAVAKACLVEAVRLNGMTPEPGAKLGGAIEDYLDKLDVDATPARPPAKPGLGGLWG